MWLHTALHMWVVAGELAALRDGEERLRSLYAESQQREKVLVRRLAAKEQEMQDYVVGFFNLALFFPPLHFSFRVQGVEVNFSR